MILDIREIDTYYGLGHILHGLSLRVDDGEVVALLGRNGAGKTTTLRSITGLTPPRSGQITYKGANIAGLPAHRISRLGIALVPETRGIFSYLTARENLEIARRSGSRWPMENVLERWRTVCVGRWNPTILAVLEPLFVSEHVTIEVRIVQWDDGRVMLDMRRYVQTAKYSGATPSGLSLTREQFELLVRSSTAIRASLAAFPEGRRYARKQPKHPVGPRARQLARDPAGGGDGRGDAGGIRVVGVPDRDDGPVGDGGARARDRARGAQGVGRGGTGDAGRGFTVQNVEEEREN